MKNLNVLFLPKELYPLERVRLSDLFMKHFVSRGNSIHWVLQTKNDSDPISGKGNEFHIVGSHKSGSAFGNMFNRFRRLKKIRECLKVMEEEKIDIVIANDGIIESLIGLYISHKYHIPFVFYLSSLFFDMDRQNFKANIELKSFWKWIESYPKEYLIRFIVGRCDIFHPISDSMGDYFSKVRRGRPTMSLPLCPSSDFFRSAPKSSYKQKGPWSLYYAGQISRVRKIDLLIDLAHDLNGSNDRFDLFLIGKVLDAGYGEELNKKAKSLQVHDNVHILEEVNISQMPKILDKADIGLCILPPITAYRVSSPTKVVEYLALGIPVVANSEIDDQAYVVKQSGGGSLTNYDVKEAAHTIKEMVMDPISMEKKARNGASWVRSNRNYEIITRSLEAIYHGRIR